MQGGKDKRDYVSLSTCISMVRSSPESVLALMSIMLSLFRRVLRLAAAKLAKTPKPPYMTSVSCRDYMFHGNFHCFTEISGRKGEGDDGASKKSTNYTVEISTV